MGSSGSSQEGGSLRTVVVKLDLATGSAMSQDQGEMTWAECKLLMRALCDELRFFRKKPHSPRAVRSGNARIILAVFEEE